MNVPCPSYLPHPQPLYVNLSLFANFNLIPSYYYKVSYYIHLYFSFASPPPRIRFIRHLRFPSIGQCQAAWILQISYSLCFQSFVHSGCRLH
jgi:hypothetical protein